MKVYLPTGNLQVERMLQSFGFELTPKLLSADLVQFVGGADVSPQFYQEKPHRATRSFLDRDLKEVVAYHQALSEGIPMAGICRGGQFLHVMNGGKLWQDVDNHCRDHRVSVTGLTFPDGVVTSTHHQMMRMPALSFDREYSILAVASESTRKESYDELTECTTGHSIDLEAVLFPETNSLCFQPHPEFKGAEYTKDLYKACLNELFGRKVC